MSIITNIKKKLKKVESISSIYHNLRHFYFKYRFSNRSFVETYYRKHLNKNLSLVNPMEFSEKIQWLKLYWYDPEATKCADKYEVRNIVKQKIGDAILNEVYGVYDSVEQIDLNKLPDSFVMKATHSSGYNFVCKDKNEVNWKEQLKELNRWLKINYFWHTREWVYRDIKPRIICEKYLSEADNSTGLTDYKFYCFNGKPMYCQVIKDREAGGTIDFFDKEWNHMEFTGLQKMPHSSESIPKPKKLEEMLNISKKLSKTFPFVRVDFYYVKGQVYFGELTFFPRSGYGTFEPPEWNEKIGGLLKLSSVSK